MRSLFKAIAVFPLSPLSVSPPTINSFDKISTETTMKKILVLFSILLLFPCLLKAQSQWEHWGTLNGHKAAVTFIHFHQDYLFSGDKSGVVKIWKVGDIGGTLLNSIPAHQAEISHIEVAPDGKSFLTVGYDGYVKSYDRNTFRELASTKLEVSEAYDGAAGLEVTFADYSPNQDYIYTGGYNQKLLKLDPRSGSTKELFSSDTYGLTCGLVIPKRNWMAFAYGGEVRFVDIRNDQLESLVLGEHNGYDSYVCEIGYYPKRDWLTVWLVSGSVAIYNLKNGKLVTTIPASKKQGSCYAGIAPQAGLLATGNQPSGVIYDIESRRPIATLQKHTADISMLVFNAQETVLATASNDTQVMLWRDKTAFPDLIEEPVAKLPTKNPPVIITPKPPKKPVDTGSGSGTGADTGDFVKKEDMVRGETFVLEGLQFDQSSYALRPDARKELDKVLYWMKKYPLLSIALEGHTSDEGDADKNLQLSIRRVTSAKNYLAGNGIAEERITTQGFGEEQPIADNGTATGRVKNRRIELRILDF